MTRSSQDDSKSWVINSIPTVTRVQVIAAAKTEGLTIGRWLERHMKEWTSRGSPSFVASLKPTTIAELAAIMEAVRSLATSANVTIPTDLAQNALDWLGTLLSAVRSEDVSLNVTEDVGQKSPSVEEVPEYDGRWMTYRELALSRKTTVQSLQRYASRRRWLRKQGGDGKIRIYVPVDKIKRSPLKDTSAANLGDLNRVFLQLDDRMNVRPTPSQDSSGEWMYYSEAAVRLGVSAEAVRQLALRWKWSKRRSNDDSSRRQVQVLVPKDIQRRGQTPVQPPTRKKK